MANPERGESSVVIDKQVYTLKPTFNSVCELETQMNNGFDAIMQTVHEGRLSGLRAVVWCLLQDKHAKEIPTLSDAGEWIERLGGVQHAMVAVYQCLGMNLPPKLKRLATSDPRFAPAGISAGSSSVPVGTA